MSLPKEDMKRIIEKLASCDCTWTSMLFCKHLVELAVQEEREACAKVAEETFVVAGICVGPANEVAESIRARS